MTNGSTIDNSSIRSGSYGSTNHHQRHHRDSLSASIEAVQAAAATAAEQEADADADEVEGEGEGDHRRRIGTSGRSEGRRTATNSPDRCSSQTMSPAIQRPAATYNDYLKAQRRLSEDALDAEEAMMALMNHHSSNNNNSSSSNTNHDLIADKNDQPNDDARKGDPGMSTGGNVNNSNDDDNLEGNDDEDDEEDDEDGDEEERRDQFRYNLESYRYMSVKNRPQVPRSGGPGPSSFALQSTPSKQKLLYSAAHQLENKLKVLDADGHFKGRERAIRPWYRPPVQRIRWDVGGDGTDSPQSTNPGGSISGTSSSSSSRSGVHYTTLFFDLFFIAAIYNIGEMLISAFASPAEFGNVVGLRTVIYFLGTFGPVFLWWENFMYLRARYKVTSDYAHQLFDFLRFVCITSTVLFIRPMAELSDPQNFHAVFVFTLSVFSESLMFLILKLEVYYKAIGDRDAIQNFTFDRMKHHVIPTNIGYLAACVASAILCFAPIRQPLNDPKAVWKVTDLPLTLMACTYLGNLLQRIYWDIRLASGSAATPSTPKLNNSSPTGSQSQASSILPTDIRKTFIPVDIDLVIQRYSDWFLLLLGEVVMAMVETTDSMPNYLISFMGCLTTIVLHTLKFESEPEKVHGHALWRNVKNATSFSLLMQVLSSGLVMLGVSYKILLDDDRYGIGDSLCSFAVSGSLAGVLFTLELMVLTHKGLRKSWQRLFRRDDDTSKISPSWPLILITLFKVGLLAFLLSVPAWNPNADFSVIIGFFVVVAVAATRIIGWAFVFKEEEIKNIVNSATKKFSSFTASKRVTFDAGPSLSSAAKLYTSNRSSAVQPESENDWETHSMASSVSDTSFSIRRSEKIYDEMFDAVVVANAKGIIVSVNEAALNMFQFESKTDLMGQNISILVGGDHAKNHDMYLKAFRTRGGQGRSHIGKQRVLQARKQDGTEFPCVIGLKASANKKRLVAFIRDVSGLSDDVSGISSAITNIDVEEKQAKQIKEILNDKSGKSFDCIVVIDLDGEIKGINETFLQHFRYTDKSELVGKDIQVIIGREYTSLHANMMARYREKVRNGETITGCKVVGMQNLLPVLKKD